MIIILKLATFSLILSLFRQKQFSHQSFIQELICQVLFKRLGSYLFSQKTQMKSNLDSCFLENLLELIRNKDFGIINKSLAIRNRLPQT